MPLYRDEAVVLRVHKLGEADRIVSLLTRRHGRVRAVGKGVRRTTSRFGARLEPGSHIDVQLYTRLAEGQSAPGGQRGLDVVTSRPSRSAPFGAPVSRDYAALDRGLGHLRDRRAAHRRRASRRCGSTCSSSGRCGRSPSASATRGWCSTPS